MHANVFSRLARSVSNLLGKSSKSRSRAHKLRQRKSSLEVLDDRRVLATMAVIDFGGGTITQTQMSEGGWAGTSAKTAPSFRSLFTSSRPELDMNADGLVNSTDADLAINRIMNKVQSHYAPYNITIKTGGHDNYHNSLMNDSEPGDAIVIVSGGTDFISPSDPAFGWAPLDDGNIDDQYAFVFAKGYYDGGFGGEAFLNGVARTISHEMGHTFGLEHVEGNPHHLMSVGDARDFNHYFNFPDVIATTESGVTQNAHQYLTTTLGASTKAWAAVLREGTLTVQGSNSGETLGVLRRSDGTWDVLAGGRGGYVDPDASPDINSLNPYAGTPINSVVIYGAGGNDFIIGGGAQAAVTVFAYGGMGDDTIFGHEGRDYLRGDSGNDIVLGLEGNDDLFGDSGRDILFGGNGTDSLWGGTNDDILLGVNSTVENSLDKLNQLRSGWISSSSYTDRVAGANAVFATTTETNDHSADRLYGHDGLDMFLYGVEDTIDGTSSESKRRFA